MGTLVCQCCDQTIEHFEDEKVSKLFGVCPICQEKKEPKSELQRYL